MGMATARKYGKTTEIMMRMPSTQNRHDSHASTVKGVHWSV
jgi:hypothetical protein